MYKKFLSPKSLVTLAVVLISFLSVTFVSAHGGDLAQIHACVTSSGAIRIVGANAACTGKDSALDWNIQGPKGSIGPIGPIGPQGLPGEQGIQGLQGPAGISGWEIVERDSGPIGNSAGITSTARCPLGKKVLGGGYTLSGNARNMDILKNAPVSPPVNSFEPEDYWEVQVETSDYPNIRQNWSVQVWAICANVAP